MNNEDNNISWSQVSEEIWEDLLRRHPEYDRRHPDYQHQPYVAPVERDPSATYTRIVCRNTA